MKRTVLNVVLFFVAAVLYGLIEGTHVRFGPPTLFHTFIANYHLPLLGLVLIYAYALDRFQDIPAWIVVEDMLFWIFSGQELSKSSWISMGLSGMTAGSFYLPWTYVLLLLLWALCVLYKRRTL